MAKKNAVVNLNIKLIKGKIIDKKYEDDYPLVHKKMNSIIKKTGRVLSDQVFEKGDKAMREWLLRLYKQGASQEKLTSYLRCALAHLSLDYIESTYKQISEDDLITRALQSFKKRRLNKTFYKVPTSEIVKKKPVKKKKATAAKKTAPTKKKAVTAKKKVAKKKTTAAKKTTSTKKKTVSAALMRS